MDVVRALCVECGEPIPEDDEPHTVEGHEYHGRCCPLLICIAEEVSRTVQDHVSRLRAAAGLLPGAGHRPDRHPPVLAEPAPFGEVSGDE